MILTKRAINIVVAAVSLGIATFIYWYTGTIFTETDQRNVRLEELLALTALTFLYAAILSGSIPDLMRNSRAVILREWQPALAAAALFFGGVHGTIVFFFLLGGFEGLSFLSGRFIFGIILSTTALLTLIFVFIYNFFLSRHSWASRLVYFAALLISVHAVMLGADFITLSDGIPRFFAAVLAVILLIEIIRFDRYVGARAGRVGSLGPAFALLLIVLVAATTYFYTNADKVNTSVHSEHLRAIENLNQQGGGKRYTASLSAAPQNAGPNQDVTLSFKVYEAATGTLVTDFNIINDKLLHLIIVDGSLEYFDHIHPAFSNGEFTITHRFPKDDVYRIYIDFEPEGSIEQQIGFSLPVGSGQASVPGGELTSSTRTFGDMSVTISPDTGGEFDSQRMSSGTQSINFHFTEAQSGQPITDLMPYLGSFGHLVLINQADYGYTHVHPTLSATGGLAGPDVKFTPLALYGKITPGTYRAFGQFNRADQIITTDFTINVK